MPEIRDCAHDEMIDGRCMACGWMAIGADAMKAADELIASRPRFPPPVSSQQFWGELIQKPEELLAIITAHVAAGGTAIDLAATWGINYGVLMNWVRDDDERNKRYMKAMTDREEWMRENILREYRAIAHSDLKDAYHENGTLKLPHEMPDGVRMRIASIEVEEIWEGRGDQRELIGHMKRVKFWDKTKALQDLGKTMGMFIDVRRHEVGKTVEELVMMSAKKEETTK